MSQRYCRNCGAEVHTGDRYCSKCGQEVGTDTSYPDQYGTESQEQYDRQQSEGYREDTTQTGWDHGYQQHGEYQPDTTLAAITHVLALFTWVIGPLVIYLVTDDPFVKENAANATNWQIMFTVYFIASLFLLVVLVGFVLILVLPLLDLAFVIIAAIKASEEEAWKYPLTPDIL